MWYNPKDQDAIITDPDVQETVGLTVELQDFEDLFGRPPTQGEWIRFLSQVDDMLYKMCGGYQEVMQEVKAKCSPDNKESV